MLRASFTLLAALTWSSTVVAQPYVGIEAGTGKVRSSDVDELVVYRTTPAATGDNVPIKYDDVFSARWNRSTEFGLVGGYDFGWFRVEGELAYFPGSSIAPRCLFIDGYCRAFARFGLRLRSLFSCV